MAVITTVGGSDSNSYVSRAEADTYFSDHWSVTKSATWAALTNIQKDRLLIAATQVLESLRFLDSEYIASNGPLPAALRDPEYIDYIICRLNVEQRLQFPRNIDVDGSNVAFIPQEVKDAQCEQAVYLVAFDDSQIATQMQGVFEEAIAAGGVRVYTKYTRRGSFVAPMAIQLVVPFLRKDTRIRRG